MKKITILFLAALAFFSCISCNKKEEKTLADIQSNLAKYCADKDSVVYEFSDQRIGVFKISKKGEDTILFVRGTKQTQDLLIEANIDKNGRVFIISDKVLNSSKRGDYKIRIESLTREFYADIYGEEPQ